MAAETTTATSTAINYILLRAVTALIFLFPFIPFVGYSFSVTVFCINYHQLISTHLPVSWLERMSGLAIAEHRIWAEQTYLKVVPDSSVCIKCAMAWKNSWFENYNWKSENRSQLHCQTKIGGKFQFRQKLTSKSNVSRANYSIRFRLIAHTRRHITIIFESENANASKHCRCNSNKTTEKFLCFATYLDFIIWIRRRFGELVWVSQSGKWHRCQ